MTGPAGQSYNYTYSDSTTYANLLSVTYPDDTPADLTNNPKKMYVYGELGNTTNVSRPNALTGIIDEAGMRYATYQYDTKGKAISTEHGTGGIEKYSLTFNTDGSASVTDPLESVRTIHFNTVLGVVKSTGQSQPGGSGCSASASALTFDANGNVASRTDFNGNRTNYTYDLTRNLETSRTEGLTATGASTPETRTITTEWHPTFRLPVKIAEPGQETTWIYDNHGNITHKTVKDTATAKTRSWSISYSYSATVPGALLQKVENGPRTDVSDITTTDYYAPDAACNGGHLGCRGQISQITNALGHLTRITRYSAHGQPEEIIDPNGLVTTLAYDARQRLLSVDRGGEFTKLQYDNAGQLIRITRPDNSALNYSYDAAHRLTQISDNLGNKIVYTLDAMGNRLNQDVLDPTGQLVQTHRSEYDALSRLAKDIGADNQTSRYAYDNRGNLTDSTDPLEYTNSHNYDVLNRLLQSIDPDNGIRKNTFDARDNLTAVTDPKGNTTQYTYDGLNNLTREVSPDRGTLNYSYDSAGNRIKSIDASGRQVNYRYDALNRVTQVRYAGNAEINFTYDQGSNGIGQTTSMTDATGTSRWTYDPHGRATSKTVKTGTLTLATKYCYDSDGLLEAITYPSGKTVQLDYSTGQIKALTVNGAPLLSAIQYQPFGFATGWIFANGGINRRDFDLDGRMTAFDLGERSRQLAYDSAGRITHYSDTDLNQDQSFTYDALSRLTGVTTPVTQTAYSYDANGNRTQLSHGPDSKNYAVDASSNRLTASTANNSPLKTYRYDASGNITSDGNNTFIYDGRGRMIQVTGSFGTEQYRINGFGQRVAKLNGTPPDLAGDTNQDGVLNVLDLQRLITMIIVKAPANASADCNHDGRITLLDVICTQAKLIVMLRNPQKFVQTGTYFTYDEAGHLIGEYNQSGAAIQETVWLDDTPVAVLAGANRYFIYADHLNAPRAIADNTGKVIWRWDSEPFGTTPANEDPDKDGKPFTYNLRFPGQYYDKGTGLHYNYFRDYDPRTGRYLQSDPIGLQGGLNTYGYVGGNPVNWVDPDGRNPLLLLRLFAAFMPLIDLQMMAVDDVPGGGAGRACGAAKRVSTPYGDAIQGADIAALTARSKVENGATLYRVGTTGKSQAAEAQFWALEHPTTSGFAQRYGIPAENVEKFNFIEASTLRPGTSFVTRSAPGIGDNVGGGIEVVVPSGGVQMKWFSSR